MILPQSRFVYISSWHDFWKETHCTRIVHAISLSLITDSNHSIYEPFHD